MSDEPEETEYYLRLVSMYMDLGTETVLDVFVYHSPSKDPHTFLKLNEQTLVKLKTDRILNKQECELLLKEDNTTDKQKVKYILKSHVDFKSFDISLIITLSINLFTKQQLQPPRKGWDNPPRNNDKSIAADLLRLRTIRNFIVGHHPTARLPKWRFDEEWKNVSEILLRIQQQISQGSQTFVKERIEAYRSQIHVSPLENKYDEKLRCWQEEMSKAQDQVEDLLKKLEGFDAYFKHKCDRYERYTKLLIKGGSFVLLSFLDEQVKQQGKDIRSILDENKTILEGGITDSEHLDILFPSETNSSINPIDTSSWNISMLATLILQLFDKSIGRATKRAIKKIDDAFKNYAENALIALDSNTFEDYSTDLKASLEIVSENLDEDRADQYNQILVDSKGKIEENEFQTYMDELKTQGTQMKRMADIYKDTLQKTKDCLRDMIAGGIPFKKSHDLELKMITLGNNEEKKILAEDILTEIWLEALDRSPQTPDFADVKKEVEEIVKEIRKSKSVKNVTIKTACIILQLSCTSPNDMLNIINYFYSTKFHDALVSISKELGYYFNTALSVYSVIPIECLIGVLNCQSDTAQPEGSGIRLPITVSSPTGMLQLRSLFNSEKIANCTNAISDAISQHLDETITLKFCTDMKVFSSLFDEESCSDSSSSESSLTSSNRLRQLDVSEAGECPEEESIKNINEESADESPAENQLILSNMAHKFQLENKKYKNWVKAGLGIKYVKDGLEPFCEHLVTRQHIDILSTVKRKHNLSAVSCGLCDVRTLQPDHIQTKTRQCPLGQIQCNCKHPRGKNSCANKVCSAIYDEIIKLHASTPSTPNWRNTDAHQWCTEPWSVAKCFINAPGYEQKTKAAEIDCPGLLYVLMNNIEFQQHIKRNITGTDVFSRVLKSRNEIFHSHTMELEDNEVNSYIDDMIELLEDETEIKVRQESKDAVKNLRELKQEQFVISTTDEAEVRRVAMDAIKELKRTIADAEYELETKTSKSKHELEGKGLDIKSELEQTGQDIKKELVKKDDEIRASAAEDFQGKLVKRYEKYTQKIPSMPLQPKRNQRNISDVYVPSLMTVEIKDEESAEWKEVKISLHEIFRNKENPAKYIYVIGEAGSGKSMFCKMLVHFWCIAHSFSECSSDESDIVKEIGRFKYLFYVLLRHYSDCDSIEKMLEKSYHDPALGDILQNESSKCLIVLDGLDEWTPDKKHDSQFLTPGLPGRDLDAVYTIITTSRQCKFDALPITESEVDKKIKLRGIDRNEIKGLTVKTVKMLNDTFRKTKSADNCETDLKRRHVSDISHIPLILQQLIFLWFDDKLRDSSKYAIYSSMVALFLEWKTLKSSENQECELITQECSIYPPLHDYLCQFDTLRKNSCVIQYLSHLAYETLFNKNKETTLTFGRSTLKRLNIPNDVIKFCLNVGILTEEENVSLHASVSQHSSYSFFHKSIQEYLAAVFVASQLKEMVNSQKSLQRDEREHTDVCKKCVLKYFGSCETVVDILEQSNVFIMLCGLEPQLLADVSDYIYNVANVDIMVVEERYKLLEPFQIHNRSTLIQAIQACIFSCIDEVTSSENVHTPVYIADLYVDPFTKLLRYGKNIVLENVLSVEVNEELFGKEEIDKDALGVFLSKCDQLKAIKVRFPYIRRSDERVCNTVCKILVTNVSTLESICLIHIDEKIVSLLVSMIPKIRRLVSLKMTVGSNDVSHAVCLSLCEVLNKTTNLQHISLSDIYCEGYDEHEIDLSKHKQLQHVDIEYCSFRMVSCNSDNLETCTHYFMTSAIMNQLCNSLYKACKLKHLELHYFPSMKNYRIRGKTDDRAVTENLIKLLSLLVSLSTLTLRKFTFTDNIITCPSAMKNLKEVELDRVTMSMTTWCKFIDSLPALPQSVQVKIKFMCIRDETIDGYSMRDEKQEADVRQYVRGKANLFRVTRDDALLFRSTTRKA